MNLYVTLGDDGGPLWGRCGSCGLALDHMGAPCAAFPRGAMMACKVYAAESSVAEV